MLRAQRTYHILAIVLAFLVLAAEGRRRTQTPEPAQTFYDASGGIHPYRLCDEHAWPPHNHYCSYQDPMPESGEAALIHVWHTPNSGWRDEQPFDARDAGYWAECPERRSDCNDLTGLTEEGLESCLAMCADSAAEGGDCGGRNGVEDPCGPDLFCNYEFGGDGGGVCESCPTGGAEDCLSRGIGPEPDLGIERCLQCELKCHYLRWGKMTVDGSGPNEDDGSEDGSTGTTDTGTGTSITTTVMAYALGSAPQYSQPGSAYAPLVDCSDLVLDNVDLCPDAEGSVCLVEDFVKDTFFDVLTHKCEKSGGVALVIYQDFEDHDINLPFDSYLQSAVTIPVVNVAYKDGIWLKRNRLGRLANVSVVDAGWDDCWVDQACSLDIPCMGMYADHYCHYAGSSDPSDEGLWCNLCPDEPSECFFPKEGDPLAQSSVSSCADSCAAGMQFGRNCKLCGEPLTAQSFTFGVDNQTDKCSFCPGEDVKYPDRVVPLFSTDEGRDIKCWQVQSFFDRVDVPSSSKNCKLAQLQNYICGCESGGGGGYASASTESKRSALVWGPRVTAILSFIGSASVFYDCLRLKERRGRVFFQIMIQLSTSDMLGSIAYAFTSLPIPSEYYYNGSHGNQATCTAQGFFIQLGTISCYTNVSLAFYYYLVIKKGTGETAMKKLRLWLFLCPIFVGMVFAFAGIPFYDNVILWCNNAASWWPDIPVVIAIAIATVVMGLVCWDVYKKENASKKWRGSEARNTLSSKVFWQSFWFLMAFYATWPPYLALQYSWASGTAFGNYGFILFAGLVVPLQGFWNFWIYARTRFLKDATSRLRSTIRSHISVVRSNVAASKVAKENRRNTSRNKTSAATTSCTCSVASPAIPKNKSSTASVSFAPATSKSKSHTNTASVSFAPAPVNRECVSLACKGDSQ